MYTVLIDFTDKETKHIYRKGDTFPNKGKAKKARIQELLSENNLRNTPLIEEVQEND